MNTRTLASGIIGGHLAAAALIVGAVVSAPSVAHSDTRDWQHTARLCAAATLTADDYAHTHTRPAHYARTIRACADAVGGF